jgi:hypothetical protein
MSRFEINPNTREPFVQEPPRGPEQFSAKPNSTAADERTSQMQPVSATSTAAPTKK